MTVWLSWLRLQTRKQYTYILYIRTRVLYIGREFEPSPDH